MTREQADKWIAALRSGKYKQTTGVLRNDNGYCCLGVLCNIVDNSKWYKSVDSGAYFFDGQFEVLPGSIKDETGIKNNTGTFLVYGVPISLSSLNDEGLTFDQIADLIDYFYEEL